MWTNHLSAGAKRVCITHVFVWTVHGQAPVFTHANSPARQEKLCPTVYDYHINFYFNVRIKKQIQKFINQHHFIKFQVINQSISSYNSKPKSSWLKPGKEKQIDLTLTYQKQCALMDQESQCEWKKNRLTLNVFCQ